MTLTTKSVKSAFLALAVGGSMALSSLAQAANTYALVAGGSSALLGNFSASNPPSFSAIPVLLANNNVTITGYRTAGTPDKAFVINGTIVTTSTDGTFTENISQALVRFVTTGTNAYRLVVLLRSDSGQGVRYVANKLKITSLASATFFNTNGTAITTGADTDVDNVIASLKTDATGGGIPIQTGFSDVTADSIIRFGTGIGAGSYAGIASIPKTGVGSISVAGLGTVNVAEKPLPIQTLLLLYHYSNGAPVNFSRNQVRNIISGTPNVDAASPIYWENIVAGKDAGATQTPVSAAYRPNASGTRVTEVLDIQQGLLENQFGFLVAPAGTNPKSGTGDEITAVDANANSFGYAFVTGGAGNGKPNISVGSYNGVFPFSPTTTAPLAIPTSAIYSGSTTSSYYTEVVNGKYDLWSSAIEISLKGTTSQTVAESIAGLLDAPVNALLVHGLGFSQNSEVNANVVRSSFTSSLTGETVTDGQFLTFDTNGVAVSGNILQ